MYMGGKVSGLLMGNNLTVRRAEDVIWQKGILMRTKFYVEGNACPVTREPKPEEAYGRLRAVVDSNATMHSARKSEGGRAVLWLVM